VLRKRRERRGAKVVMERLGSWIWQSRDATKCKNYSTGRAMGGDDKIDGKEEKEA
jgi:hypothetical protein